jgi:hypothetical protein
MSRLCADGSGDYGRQWQKTIGNYKGYNLNEDF